MAKKCTKGCDACAEFVVLPIEIHCFFAILIAVTRGVKIHIPCNSIWFRLLSFDFDYFDLIQLYVIVS